MAKAKKPSPEELVAAAKTQEREDDTIRELRRTVRKLERRVRSLRSKEDIIQDAVLQALEGAMPALHVPPKPKADRRRSSREEIAVLHISDTQLGKVTSTYDTQVCEERILKSMRKTIKIAELRRSRAKIDNLRIYIGGDIVEGEDIFPHQAHEIDSPLYDQACVNGPRILAKAILMAVEAFPNVWVGEVDGNHGRNGPRGTRSSPKTNWDKVLSNTLRTILLGTDEYPRKELAGRLTYHQAEEFYFVDRVFAWGNLVVHGHQISGGFAGFPWYGVAKKAWGWIDAIEEPWDNLFFGHFHTPAMATLGHRRFYANGTTESDNNFAKEQLAACGVPAQRLLFMDAEHGVLSDDILELVPRKPTATRFVSDEFIRLAEQYK